MSGNKENHQELRLKPQPQSAKGSDTARDFFKTKVQEDSKKGLVTYSEMFTNNFTKIKNKLGEYEAENQLLQLQINGLAEKIQRQPEKNNIETIQKDPSGSTLMLNIKDIEMTKFPSDKKYEFLQYSIKSQQNQDDFISSNNSVKKSQYQYSFQNKMKVKMNINALSDQFLIKIYTTENTKQIQINEQVIKISLEELQNIFLQEVLVQYLHHEEDEYTFKIKIEYQWVFSPDQIKQRKLIKKLEGQEKITKQLKKDLAECKKIIDKIQIKLKNQMPDLSGIEEEEEKGDDETSPKKVDLKTLKDLDEFNKVNNEKDGSGSARANQPAQSMMNYPTYVINNQFNQVGKKADGSDAGSVSGLSVTSQLIRKMMMNSGPGQGTIQSGAGYQNLQINPFNYAHSMMNLSQSHSTESLKYLQKQREQNTAASGGSKKSIPSQ